MSNLQFSAMVASYSVNKTWTPVVAGLIASQFGTARSSLFATSLILLGQIILLLGRRAASVALMAAGLFVFGLGVSPVSVVQVGRCVKKTASIASLITVIFAID